MRVKQYLTEDAHDRLQQAVASNKGESTRISKQDLRDLLKDYTNLFAAAEECGLSIVFKTGETNATS